MSADVVAVFHIDFEKETLAIDGNVKREMIAELLSDYLQDQMFGGAGPHENKELDLNKQVYTLYVGLEFDTGTWYTKDDCESKGLEVGILMHCLSMLKNYPEKITWKQSESSASESLSSSAACLTRKP